MAGRRAQPPIPVPSLSIPQTGHAPTDRANKQVEGAVQDLQQRAREGAAAATAAQAAADAASAAAAAVPTAGRLLAAPLVLTGTGSGTLPAGTCTVHLVLIGQGGGGGGAVPTAGPAGGAGGSTGVKLDLWIGTPGTPLASPAYSWAMGSGANGGSAAGGAGGVGADSTVTINGTTYTSKGGGGGGGSTGAADDGFAFPTSPAAGTTAGGFRGFGHGQQGRVVDGGAWFGGQGGSTDLGGGGVEATAVSAGNPGDPNGFGGGGGGAATNAGGRAGGDGAAGGGRIETYS